MAMDTGGIGDFVEGIQTLGGRREGDKCWSLLDSALKIFSLLLASSTIDTAKGYHPPSWEQQAGPEYDSFHGVGTAVGMPTRALRAGGPGHTDVSEEGCANSRKGREIPGTGAKGQWDRAPEGWAHSWQEVLEGPPGHLF